MDKGGILSPPSCLCYYSRITAKATNKDTYKKFSANAVKHSGKGAEMIITSVRPMACGVNLLRDFLMVITSLP